MRHWNEQGNALTPEGRVWFSVIKDPSKRQDFNAGRIQWETRRLDADPAGVIEAGREVAAQMRDAGCVMHQTIQSTIEYLLSGQPVGETFAETLARS